MNILQLVPRLEVGGVERGTFDLARFLTLNAHKAVVISEGGNFVKKLDEVGARHYALPIGSKNPFTVINMVHKVSKIIRKENIEIIHARSRIPALIGFIASRITSGTFITTAHGQYKRHLISYIMGWGKIVIVASPAMARYMAEKFGVRPDKIRIIPRGVDTGVFKYTGPGEKQRGLFTIGMISRVTRIKGHLDFIKAVSLVSRAVPRMKAYIIGNKSQASEEYVREIESAIRKYGLQDLIEFADQTDNVPSMLQKLDVLVSANREQEAFGRIIIEAQSSGVPVVATRVGGISDIIEDGKTGLLCEPGNPDDIAGKIIALRGNLPYMTELALRARESVEKNYELSKMIDATLLVYKEAVNSRRILIIKMSALGDVILSMPSVRAIRHKYPDAVIKVLVNSESSDVFKNCPYVDDVIINKTGGGIKGLLKMALKLRMEDFDIVLDLQNNKRSHILAFLSCANTRCGYDNGKLGFLLNRKVKDAGIPLDPVRHQMKVLTLLGIGDIDRRPELFVSGDDSKWAGEFLKHNRIGPADIFICLNMESSPKWVSKRWPVMNFVKLSDRLADELSLKIVVTGKDKFDEWNKRFMALTKSKPVSALGMTTIGRLKALIERAGALVTGDSAPMHIASGVATPYVALFGPTDPDKHVSPHGEHLVFFKKAECAPCYKPACVNGNVCMKAITVDEVFDAVSGLVKKKRNNTVSEKISC